MGEAILVTPAIFVLKPCDITQHRGSRALNLPTPALLLLVQDFESLKQK